MQEQLKKLSSNFCVILFISFLFCYGCDDKKSNRPSKKEESTVQNSLNEAEKFDYFKEEYSVNIALLSFKHEIDSLMATNIAIKAKEEGFKGFILPRDNAKEAAIVNGLEVYGVENIKEVIDYFDTGSPLEQTIIDTRAEFYKTLDFPEFDFADVKGQESIKRCMEIAAAGGHNIILIGPPGSGKTMLAKRLPSILPPMTLHEALETTKIHSVVGKVKNMGLMNQRPFRSPHHTISDVLEVGG